MGETISAEKQSRFDKAFKKLLRNNAFSFVLSVANEAVIGHSALGFGQASMELTDAGMAVGLKPAERAERRGQHNKASKIRKHLYALHIAVAGIGTAEAARLMREGTEPNLGNIAVSGIVGLINGHYIYHELKHKRGEAHKSVPDMKMAHEDPIEVVQDERMGFPDTQTLYDLNHDGTIAIAKTNVVEATGGLTGAVAQFGWERGGAVAMIASSIGVAAIMARQIAIEHNTMNGFRGDQSENLTQPISGSATI